MTDPYDPEGNAGMNGVQERFLEPRGCPMPGACACEPLDLIAALRSARTLVISYRAQEVGKNKNRREYCEKVLAEIDAALGIRAAKE